jgi:hypothetical protein
MIKNKPTRSMGRRYATAYLSLIGIIAAFVVVSVAQGAGWKPALAGMPLYIVVFLGITYQLIREIVKLRKQT